MIGCTKPPEIWCINGDVLFPPLLALAAAHQPALRCPNGGSDEKIGPVDEAIYRSRRTHPETNEGYQGD
jgi:hypothetical protein